MTRIALQPKPFCHLDVVDAVSAELGAVHVVEGQLHAVVHVEAALRLPDQTQVRVVHHDVDVSDVELRADREFLDEELEVVVTRQRDDGGVRVGGRDPERRGHGPPERAGLARR